MSQIPFDAVRAWVFQDALPFWAAHGVDRVHGGFLEEVGLDGAPTACGFKRVRVICRQTYAFATPPIWAGPKATRFHAWASIILKRTRRYLTAAGPRRFRAKARSSMRRRIFTICHS